MRKVSTYLCSVNNVNNKNQSNLLNGYNHMGTGNSKYNVIVTFILLIGDWFIIIIFFFSPS